MVDMTNEIKEVAEKGRVLYNSGQISRDEAVEMITPYINACNEKSKELAKKYNMKPKKITFAQYIR